MCAKVVGSNDIVVLLVDDQLIIGEAIRRAVADQPDISLHYCSDPAAAVLIAQQIKPTVILQDLVMPGTDGLTLVHQYRTSPATKDVPIIVLSTKEGQVRGLRTWCQRLSHQTAGYDRALGAHPLPFEGVYEPDSARRSVSGAA